MCLTIGRLGVTENDSRVRLAMPEWSMYANHNSSNSIDTIQQTSSSQQIRLIVPVIY